MGAKRVVAVAVGAILALLPATGSAGSDPWRSQQWALDRIRASTAWSTSTGSGVTVAVVDTGIDLDHPDLQGKIAAGYTCIGSCKAGGNDDHGHGSHVAGIAAAVTGNDVGVSGVAPRAKLMAVKVLSVDSEGDASGTCEDVVRGIRWAAARGARVINLSLGGEIVLLGIGIGFPSCQSDLTDAAEYAWSKGGIVVIAAGNGSLLNLYSSNAQLLVVGATGPNDTLASYSNTGGGIDIYAPGGDSGGSDCTVATCVASTWKDGGYGLAEGTSMATPHVSGVAALLLAQGLTNQQAVDRILSTAHTTTDGLRRVDAAKAVGATGGTSGGGGGSGGSGGGSGGSGGGSGGSGSSGLSTPRGGSGGTPTPPASPSGVSPSASPASVGPQASGGVAVAPSIEVVAEAAEKTGGSRQATPVIVAAALLGLVGGALVLRRRIGRA